MSEPYKSGSAPGARQLRVGEELRHALAQILQSDGIRDPDLAGLSITVTEVRVGSDLRSAKVFVMPLGGKAVDGMVSALTRAAPYLRGRVAREVRLRFVPRLSFSADNTFDEVATIDRLLHAPGVARDLAQDGRDDGV